MPWPRLATIENGFYLLSVTMPAKQTSHREEGRAIPISQQNVRRSTGFAGSVRDCAIAISCVTSSFPIINSTTSRGAAMMQGLVQRIN
jgi:hypothetical protein